MPKERQRKAILARRRELSDDEASSAGREIQGLFLTLPDYIAAGSVALYWPVNNEVSTDIVMAASLAAGKTVYLPAVIGDTLEFRRTASVSELVPGCFGVLEPAPGGEVGSLASIDMFVVPGVGFDMAGQRIGYGRGYYDRALHSLEGEGRLTAFCYEFQLVSSLSGEAHDVVMDRIITERRIITPALLK